MTNYNIKVNKAILLLVVGMTALSSCRSTKMIDGMYTPAGSYVSEGGTVSGRLPGVKYDPVTQTNRPALNQNQSKEKMRQSVVVTARKYLGCKYKAGAMGPKRFDCSGLTTYVFQQYGILLNRSSRDQFKNGVEVKDTKKLLPGDLVFWTGSNARSKEIGHVGIVVEAFSDGTFTFIHAAMTGVQIDRSDAIYYKTRYRGARRVIN